MHGTLIGNLTEDAKFSQGRDAGSDRLEFRVAEDQGYGDKKTTAYWTCKVWGKRATALERLLTRGRLVAIVGETEQREYDDPRDDRRKVRVTDIRVNDVKLLDSGDRDRDDRGPRRDDRDDRGSRGRDDRPRGSGRGRDPRDEDRDYRGREERHPRRDGDDPDNASL